MSALRTTTIDPCPEGDRTYPMRARWIVLALVLVLAGSFWVGRYPVLEDSRSLIKWWSGDSLGRRVLLDIRVPRVLTAVLAGMVLSGAGMVFQMVFRNPLVDAGFLGVSQGAAFGASLAIVAFGGVPLAVQGSAGVFALVGLGASYFFARRIRYGDWVLRLVLAGIAVSALYAALTGVVKYLADPLRQLPDITFWLLGGLWGVTWPDLIQLLVICVPCLAVLHLLRWRLNLLAMRDETTFSLSAHPNRERLVLLLAGVVSTAAVVSKAGQIGWVGLIMPHIARRLVGADAQRALPASILLGGVFVLICDDVARTALTGEIPLGVLTSMAGAAVFLIILTRHRIRFRP